MIVYSTKAFPSGEGGSPQGLTEEVTKPLPPQAVPPPQRGGLIKVNDHLPQQMELWVTLTEERVKFILFLYGIFLRLVLLFPYRQWYNML